MWILPPHTYKISTFQAALPLHSDTLELRGMMRAGFTFREHPGARPSHSSNTGLYSSRTSSSLDPGGREAAQRRGCWSFTALNFTPHFFQWFHILDLINCKVYLASLHSSAICLLLICIINWCIALNSRIFILTAVWSWVTKEELMWENRRRPLKQSSCVHMRRTEEYQEHPSRASSLLIQIHWNSFKWKCYKSNNRVV